MRTPILIDNCVWDLLWNRQVELLEEQGTDLAFRVSPYGTQEIPAEDHPCEKSRLVGIYARDQLAKLGQSTVQWFACSDLDDPNLAGLGGLGDLQLDGSVVGGGYLGTVEGQDYREANQHRVGGQSGTKIRKSGLLHNQTDVDYGEWSFGMPVVTLNVKDYRGAGTVVDLRSWAVGGFGDFIRSVLTANKS